LYQCLPVLLKFLNLGFKTYPMDKRIFTYIFLPLLVISFNALSQTLNIVPELKINRGDIEFDHLYFEDSDDLFYVQDILADSQGFLWIATREGLFRYDAKKIIPIGDTEEGFNIFRDESVLSLFRESEYFWVSTTRSICKINTTTLTFDCYPTPLHNEPSVGSSLRGTIYVGDDGIVYSGYWNGGMIIFDPAADEMDHLFSKSSKDNLPFKENTVTSIKKRDESSLWIVSHDGLFAYFPQSGIFQPVIADETDHLSGFYQFNCMHNSIDGTIWLGSNNGLLRYNPGTGSQKRYFFDQAPIPNFEKNVVESVTETLDGMLWIGTRYGLYQMDPYTENTEAFYHQKNQSGSLQRNYVRVVYADKNDLLWIGHHTGTISLLSGRQKDFTSYTLLSDHIGEQRVHSVYSEDDKIWFGTETGLFLYDRNREQLKKFMHEPGNPHSLSHNFVSGILEDSYGYLWVSTDKGGLNRFNPTTGRFENIIKGSHGLATQTHTDIWSMYLDKQGIIWCGTGGDGLIGHNVRTGETMRYRNDPANPNSLSSNFIGPVVRGHDGTIWVGTTRGGLNYFVPGTSAFNHIEYSPESENSLSGHSIAALCLTNDNKLYIGGTAGIDILDISSKKLTPFRFNDNLPGRAVQSIVLDKTGNFWIATNRGLMKYEPATDTYQVFIKSDGLSSNFFQPGSFHHAHTGEIFFGSQNGFISFYPWDIKKNPNQPPIAITDIKVHGNSLIINPDPDQKPDLDKLSFPYHKNYLTFHFSSLDFNDPDKNQVKYKLSGFDNDWITDRNNGVVSYNNLPAGTYTFRVIGSNNDNVWNTEGAMLTFTINPPFWETLWFKFLVFIAILCSVFLFTYLQINKVSHQKKELERLVSVRTAELNEHKEKLESKNKFLQTQKNAIEHQALLLSETNQKLEEQKLAIEKQARELEEMDRIKSSFFASISHEFRTPLTLILNAISILQKEAVANQNNDHQSQIKLSIIHKNARRLHRLIDQVLDLVKIESGFMKLLVSEGNIREFVQSVAAVFAVKAEQEKIHLEARFSLESKNTYADWDKLEKILYNLISNAIKFSKANGEVVISTSEFFDDQNRRMIRIDVKDHGCGIPKELHPKVFSMFFRNEQACAGNINSTGIGLALAKQLSIIHKGDIQFESELSRGSTFMVIIPADKKCFSQDEISVPSKMTGNEIEADAVIGHILKHPKENNDPSKPRILFVDDNKELCYLMQEQLKTDFHVEVAHDGVQGVEKCHTTFPDIIVSDLMMPGISGIEFCRRIKEDLRTEHLPFIILTARIDKKSEVDALLSHADDYVTKPFSMDVLILKLKNQLELRRKIEEKLRGEVKSNPVEKTHNYSNRFLTAATQVILDQMEDPEFSVDNLAESLNMSRTQLYRKSEKLLGMSANNYIKTVKLKRAWEILQDGEFNVSDVAYKAGFKTPGYFSKCFESQFGVLPSKFLADLKDNGPLGNTPGEIK
jgi:signal transduction histidine kinase/ligand-binding sensor domain-containing protein/CheY-like chemotaxis protein